MTTAMWRASELEALGTRPIWRKRVTIFGRSVSLALLLLAITVTAALAWGAYLLVNVEQSTTIDVKAAPAAPTVNYGAPVCEILGGAGVAGAAVWDEPSKTLTCSFTDFDETSSARSRINVNNYGGGDACLFNVSVPSSPNLDISGPSAQTLPGATEIVWATDYAGNGSTLAAAGTQIGPFSTSFDIQDAAEFGGTCP